MAGWQHWIYKFKANKGMLNAETKSRLQVFNKKKVKKQHNFGIRGPVTVWNKLKCVQTFFQKTLHPIGDEGMWGW